MAKKNFVVHKGTTVGAANIDAATGDLVTGGNITANGSATITGNITANGSATITGNITANANLSVGNNVTVTGNTTSSNFYQGQHRVLDESSRFNITAQRVDVSYTTNVVPLASSIDFEIDIGSAVVVYALTVSRPCRVEVFNSATRNERNPYTFVATAEHLTDDGSTLMSDGSVIQSRQYSIFANLDNTGKAYFRITNIDNVTTPVTVEFTYFAGVAGILV